MTTTFTDYGWKTKTVVREYYKVQHIGPWMLVDTWIECNERMFPKDVRRHHCQLCKTPWREKPLLENVYVVIFKEKHRNKTICLSCYCKIIKSMKGANNGK